jgi:hypothetical protein
VSTYLTEINYENLVEKSLKNVVIDSLKIAEQQGLPGDHHFYITFKTNHPKAQVSKYLLEQYPSEMTIVIQHQFFDLKVQDSFFSIGLSFGGIRQDLKVPFDAITYFADPYAKFALSFTQDDNLPEELNIEEPQEEIKKVSNSKADIVDITAFRKK